MSKNSIRTSGQYKTSTAVALFLMLAIAFTLVALPATNAHTPPRIYKTYPRIHVAPNPVGVGQEVIIVGMMNWALPGANFVNDVRFKNLTATLTKPDGTKDVQRWDLAPDPGGSAFYVYTPDQVGVYTVLFEHHGTSGVGTVYTWNQTTNPELTSSEAANYGNIWLPASASTTFTVQEAPVGTPLVVPLPTEYWSRPIEGQNWLWDTISSNWLAGQMATGASTGIIPGTRWQQDGSAPRTPHIMWTKPIEFGGMVGGNTINEATFYSGFSYETRFENPMIIGGILYYRAPIGHDGDAGGYYAVNLRTGEQIWFRNDMAPTKGQLFDFQSPNQHGTVGGILYHVSGSTWRAYDAFTGIPIFNLTNVPSGFEVYDTRARTDFVGATVGLATVDMPLTRAGDIVRYQIQYPQRQLRLWSVAKAVGLVSPLYGAEGWRSNDKNINASNAFLWNVTIPNLPGEASPSIIGVIPGDIIVGTSSGIALTFLPRPLQPDPWTLWALSDKPETRGQLLWIRNYTAPPGNITRMTAYLPLDPVNRVLIMTDFETGQRHGYSIDNGDLLWSTQLFDLRAMQLYSSRQGHMAYGILYVSGYGGEIMAYSTNNGTKLWTFNDTDTSAYSTGIPWGLQPLHVSAIADGVVYAFAGEHSPNTPLYKGNRNFAIDAFTGKKIWSMYGWSASGLGTTIAPIAIADGFLVYKNAYDGQIYTIGKGPSATTVSIQNDVITHGKRVLIKGTVMDIAAGTKQHEQSARFPHGVPAVSDESMTAWMEYVYMQKPRPANAVGVEVTLTVVDPNNNIYDIGTVTSDSAGMFSLMWEPPVPGKYTVIAQFAGSEGYWPSYAETALGVEEAPAATPPPTPPPASVADVYLVPGIIGIILAIAVVGAVIVLMLRKR